MSEVLTITVPKGFIEKVDRVKGATKRSPFIVQTVLKAIEKGYGR